MRIRLMQSTYVGTFLAAVGLIYVIFLYYTTSSNLRLAESKLEKLTEINERLAAQQQVVVGHKQRLERSLDEAKERLIAAKEDAEKRYQGVKALKEELQQKLEQETAARVRVEEDSKRQADQNHIEYQSLKQEKDADIARLTNDFNGQKAEAQRQKSEVDRLQADTVRLRKDLEAALADAEKAKELQKTIATLEVEVMRLRQSAASATTAPAAAPAAVVAATAAAARLVPVPGGSSTTAPELHEGSQAAAASVVAAAGPAQFSAGSNRLPQRDDGAGQYVASATARTVVTERAAAAAAGGGATAASAAAAAAGVGAVGMDIVNRGINQFDEQHRQLAVPLGLGDGKEHDEKVADHVGGGDDDDGGAGNGDEDDAEDRDHELAHAKPHMQLPLPQGLLMKHLRKAGTDDRQPAGVLTAAAGAQPQAAANAADSMQMGKPPGMHGNLEDQHRPRTRAAANNLPDAL